MPCPIYEYVVEYYETPLKSGKIKKTTSTQKWIPEKGAI
jgi:hypothetical protein